MFFAQMWTTRRRKTRPVQRRTPRVGLERLEDRTLPSAFYSLTTLASTAGGSFTSFGDLPAINELGDVAFVGNSDAGNGLYIAGRNGQVANINPTFTANNDGRTYGRSVAINGADNVVARDQLGTQFLVRRWTGTVLNQHTDLFHTPVPVLGSPDDQFASAQTFTAINDNGDMAFVGYDQAGGARYVLKESGNKVGDGTYTPVGILNGTGGTSSPRPQLTLDGRVLYASPGSQLFLARSLTNRELIAGSGNGFTSIGMGAGVSPDGRIVVFTGDRGHGPGLFAVYQSGGASRTIIRLAGEDAVSHDGFTSFDETGNVVVNNSEANQRGVTVVFEGTNKTLGQGLYSVRVSFLGDSATDFDPNDPANVLVNGITPVALKGEAIRPGGPTITDVELGEGVNGVGRGEIAFWAQTSDNQQQIVLAEPRQVVWVNFDPAAASSAGQTPKNLALLQEVGVTADGWNGSFLTSLRNLGIIGLSSSLESDVIAAVQKMYTDAGASVLVLGAPSDTPPPYVPYVVTNAAGQPVGPDGKPVQPGKQPVTFGAYQTILVGGAPVDPKTGAVVISNAGLASSAYSAAGELDFFNQILGDTAVVFADNIVRSPAFPPDTNLDTIPYNVLVHAFAATIAHESGHNFGLAHLDDQLSAQVMHGGTNLDEFQSPQAFGTTPQPVDASKHPELQGVTQNDANRLRYATGATSVRDAPNPALLAITDPTARAKLSTSLTGPSVTVAHLLVGITGQDDLLPVYQDLGGGDLATLLQNLDLPVTPEEKITIIGSTDGTTPDVVGLVNGTRTGRRPPSLGARHRRRSRLPLLPVDRQRARRPRHGRDPGDGGQPCAGARPHRQPGGDVRQHGHLHGQRHRPRCRADVDLHPRRRRPERRDDRREHRRLHLEADRRAGGAGVQLQRRRHRQRHAGPVRHAAGDDQHPEPLAGRRRDRADRAQPGTDAGRRRFQRGAATDFGPGCQQLQDRLAGRHQPADRVRGLQRQRYAAPRGPHHRRRGERRPGRVRRVD
jgi:hypothetical protein